MIGLILHDYPEVITVEDLLDILLIGRNSAYRLLKSGEIKSIKIGHTYRIPILSGKRIYSKPSPNGFI
ncbi:MAG: helix-turn-helix domain-containing protein [Bacillota bacterium]